MNSTNACVMARRSIDLPAMADTNKHENPRPLCRRPAFAKRKFPATEDFGTAMKTALGMICLAMFFSACNTAAPAPRVESGIMQVVIDEAYAKPGAEFGKDVIVEGHLQNVPGFTLDKIYPVVMRYYASNGELLQEADGANLIPSEDFVMGLSFYCHFQIRSHLVPKNAAFTSVTVKTLASERAKIRD